jgi:hypothetical protein
MNGKLVATLFNSVAEKKVLHHVSFEAGKLPAGVYICRLQTNTNVTQQKIVLKK